MNPASASSMTASTITAPVVSVVMPVHNGERYLREAIESVLNQTYERLELLVVNDGSTDGTADILKEMSRVDKGRLRPIERDRIGFAKALNLGIEEARGKYIARMDADDIAMSDRLARQVAFLDAHPDHVLCGTAIRTFGDCVPGVVTYPRDHESIRCILFWECCFCHPSVLMRREPFTAGRCAYREEYGVVADYDLWTQMVELGKAANLPQVLLHYRRHASQASTTEVSTTNRQIEMVWLREARRLLPCEGRDAELHCSLAARRFELSGEYQDHARRWIEKLDRSNEEKRLYDRECFQRQLRHLWFNLCRHRARHGTFRPAEYTAIAPALRSWRLLARLLYHYCRGAA